MMKKKTKNLFTYLSEKLVQSYLSEMRGSYFEKQQLFYNSQYPDLFISSPNLIRLSLFMMVAKILEIIYLYGSGAPNNPKNLTPEKQTQFISILQTLETQPSFDIVKKQLREVTGENSYPSYFETIFDFIHAKTIYLNEKKLPSHVEDFLKKSDEDLSKNLIQEYVSYLHEMTTTCIRNFIEHALCNFERLLSDVAVTGVKDTRVRTQKSTTELTNNSVCLQFSEEPGSRKTASVIQTPSSTKPLSKPALGPSVRFQFQQESEDQENKLLVDKKEKLFMAPTLT